MKRYIDADALIENKFKNDISYNAFVNLVKRQPIYGAVPVVRCKECKHNSLKRMTGNAFCELGIGLSQLSDFCSKGERREDAEVH